MIRLGRISLAVAVPLLAVLAGGAAVEPAAKQDLSDVCGKAQQGRIVGMVKFFYRKTSKDKIPILE